MLAALAWQFRVGSAADAASGYTVVDFGALPEGKSQVARRKELSMANRRGPH